MAACGSEEPPEVDRTDQDASAELDAGRADGGCDGIEITATAPTFPCDVGAVIERKCTRCHVERGASCPESCILGPFPLVTWQDTRIERTGGPVWVRMAGAIRSGFMPLTTVALDPPVEPLTDEEKGLLLEWLDACALPADGAVCE